MNKTNKISIQVEKIQRSQFKPSLDYENIPFGKTFTDHIFITDYEDGIWKIPRIVPYQKLCFSPAISTLHYAQAIFEGLKAYRNLSTQDIYIFRPYDNFKRFNCSASRMCMPAVPEEIFIEGMSKLIDIDRDWVSNKKGCSLYIRPFLFATDAELGLKPSSTYKFIILLCVAGKYYSEPVKIRIETSYTRSAAGGTGYAKAAGNYGASLYPIKLAQEQGYHQLLWTDAKEHRYIEEAGTMNVFLLIKDTLVTAPVGDTILKGITRDSVIQIAKEWNIDVEERPIKVSEIIKNLQGNTLKEAFGVGTAVTIAPISLISCVGRDYILPKVHNSLSEKLLSELENIKYGETPDVYQWLYKI